MFLRPPEVIKVVLPKVLQNFEKTPKCTCWPKEPNQKGFPRNIQYRTRPKGPPLDFFRHCATFVQIFFSPKGPPLIFLEFCDRMDVEKCPRLHPFSFFGIVRFFFQKVHKKVSNSAKFTLETLKSFCYFLSLSYGANLGWSRIVFNSHSYFPETLR